MSELATAAATALVPQGFAEKAMASLMQLHTELMDEKEKRVDLFRKLMEREQALAEFKAYVKVLEERLAHAQPVASAPAPAPVAAAPRVAPVPPAPRAPTPRSAPPPHVTARPRVEGWKTW
jgi:hypothetical protein